MTSDQDEKKWPCTWDDAARVQFQRSAARTFEENLRWLEETSELAMRFSQAKWLVLPASLRNKAKKPLREQ
jgi:hypothetical protein